ncbi:hypothetical protein ACWGII_41735 [Streptomyces sp. NPDC054855]
MLAERFTAQILTKADPDGAPLPAVRDIRDAIDTRVTDLPSSLPA